MTLLALIRIFSHFGVGGQGARATYGVKAPATTGNEIFERYFRVQQNTLELMIVFLPALWIAARYWNPRWIAAIGVVYLVGRTRLFPRLRARSAPARSSVMALSIVPIVAAGAGGIDWRRARAAGRLSDQSRKMKNAATTIRAKPTRWFHLIAAPRYNVENTTKTSSVMISCMVFSCAGL